TRRFSDRATGSYEHIFGISAARLEQLLHRIRDYRNIQLKGLACHLGSQMTDLTPLAHAAREMVQLMERTETIVGPLEHLDMGGGLGISYGGEETPSADAYAKTLLQPLQGQRWRLILEPGRWLIGQAGVLLSRVLYRKESPSKKFL